MFERLALYPCSLYVKRYKVFQLAKRIACRIRIKCWTILFPRRSAPPFYVVVASSVACGGMQCT